MREGKPDVRGVEGEMLRLSVSALLLAGCARHVVERQPSRADEINTLWTQIREWRREAGLALDPACAQLISFTPDHVGGDCAHVASASSDACGLGDAICDNAETICILADEMRPNLWAHDKCTSALSSCREVRQLCVLAVD